MANYTNQVPANLNVGDILTFDSTGNGNYVFPRGVYNITVASGRGGEGRDSTGYVYQGAQANDARTYTYSGGKGGSGLSCTFQWTLQQPAAISTTSGGAGRGEQIGWSATGWTNGTQTSNPVNGGAGGSSTLSIDGVVVALVTGGGGGGGGTGTWHPSVASSGGGWTRSHSGSNGSNGAAGAVKNAPVGYTTAINTGAGYIKFTVVSLNSPPSVPSPIEYDTPLSNRSLDMTCGTSVDPDPGDTVSYIWEQRVDGGVWSQVGISDAPEITVTAPASGNSVTYRVKAADNHGAESAYATGSAKTIIYNFPPVISGVDEDKGDMHDPFSYVFSVDDPDVEDIIDVRVYLDARSRELLAIDGAVRNQNYTVNLEEIWEYTSTGKHTLIIYAKDDKGGEAFRNIAFTRDLKKLEVELEEPVELENIVMTVLPFINYTANTDATLLIQLKNDPAASWEDATRFNYAGEIYKFVNENKTVSPSQFQCRVTIDKGDSGGEIVFYGGSFVLNANGNEVSYAPGVWVNPYDITEGGVLTAADTNVMLALNTLSLAAGQKSDIATSGQSMVPVCKSKQVGTTTESSYYEIPDPEVWAKDRICTVVKDYPLHPSGLTLFVNPSNSVSPSEYDVQYVFLPKGSEEPPSYDSGDTVMAAIDGVFPCDLATENNIGATVYADRDLYDYGNSGDIPLGWNENYGCLTLANTGWAVAKVVAPGWIRLTLRDTGVEMGSNNYGQYAKFSDGLLICWNTRFYCAAANTHYTWYFPASFAQAPSVQMTANQTAIAYPYVYYSNGAAYAQIRTATAGSYFDLLAVGRWK